MHRSSQDTRQLERLQMRQGYWMKQIPEISTVFLSETLVFTDDLVDTGLAEAPIGSVFSLLKVFRKHPIFKIFSSKMYNSMCFVI